LVFKIGGPKLHKFKNRGLMTGIYTVFLVVF
jgi:hypothetical protein